MSRDNTTTPPSAAAPTTDAAAPTHGSGTPTRGTGPAGGATPTSGSGRTTPPPQSSSVPPTLGPPRKPPQDPTDRVRTDTIGGWITRGGSGPCYGLIDDDGREYALYGPDAGTLVEGTRVVVRTAPLTKKVDCGPGQLVGLRSVRRLT